MGQTDPKPDVSVDVEHNEVEVPLLQLNEGQVGHQGAAQEEEGVNSRESVEHSLAQKARVAEKQLNKEKMCQKM